MKYSKPLLSFLYYFSMIAFVFALAITIYVVSFETFSKSSQVGNFQSSNHHSVGYNFPITIQTSIPDSVITNLSNDSQNSHRYYEDQQNLHPIFTDNKEPKNKITNEITVWPKLEENSYQITKELKNSFPITYTANNISSDGYARLNSNIFWIKFLLALRSYIAIVVLAILLIMIQIFKKLRIDLNFSKSLAIKTRVIGFIILGYQFINTSLILILSNYFTVIRVDSLLNNVFFDRGLYVNITPRLDFNVSIFILGLSIIIIGFLFDQGEVLKQENELTI